MKNKKVNFDQFEQDFLIKTFVEHNNSHSDNQNIILIESPIHFVSNDQLNQKESIPDAIIQNENGYKKWLELTTFSRCQDMRKQMGEIAKYPERFEGEMFIKGISANKFIPLENGFREAVSKKLNKNYAKFSELARLPSLGVLVVMTRMNDIFLNDMFYNKLVDTLRDRNLLFNLGVYQGQFDQIILGSYVYNDATHTWRHRFSEIADISTIAWAKKKYETKQSILMKLNNRAKQIEECI